MKKTFIFSISLLLLLNACGGGSLSSGTNNHSNTQSTNNNSNDSSRSYTVNSVSLNNARGEEIWQTCKGCHGTNAEKSALGKSDIIGGQNKATTIVQITEYRAGTLEQHGMGRLMKGQTQNLTDSDIEDVAGYIETLSGY
jgi:cytochrome c553